MKEVTSTEDFKKVLEQGKPILLDFYADWCGPCQAQLPIVETLAEQHKGDFIIAKVNVDKNGALAQEFRVRSIPALFIIADGMVKEGLVGLQSKAVLDQKIHKYSNSVSH
ncbi:MAG: thioredoxin [Aureispira sp.]|nr:thioredoxin [Aureispira sp.]